MITVEAPGPLEPAGFDWSIKQSASVRERLLGRVRRISEIGVLAIASFGLYLATVLWMHYHEHFFINDALNRTADALYVTMGRDPHLGAIGFYWPPLPQLLNMPFVPFLEPFRLTVLAGPLETAVCMALTIPVLGRIGRDLGLSRWTVFAVCAVFALNPVTVYNASNGMSEASFFLTVSLSLLGFLRYIRSRSVPDTILFGVGLALLALTRLEGPAIVVALVVSSTFSWDMLGNRQVARQRVWDATLVALPAAGVFLGWILMQWVLLKDPFFFLHQPGAKTPTAADWLPAASEEPHAAYPWAAHWLLALGSLIAVLAVYVILRPRAPAVRGSLGVCAVAATVLAIQIYTVGYKGGFGDPRYFSVLVPVATVAAMILAAEPRPALASLTTPCLVAALATNAGVANWTMSSGTTTGIEHECVFFQRTVAAAVPFLGRGGDSANRAYCPPYPGGLRPFELAGAWLDKRLDSRDLVLTDNESMFAADLFTTHPGQYVVRNDRDYHKLTSNPAGHITYIVTAATTRAGVPEAGTGNIQQGYQDDGATIIIENPAAWDLVASFPGSAAVSGRQTWVQIYRANGSVPPAGINTPG